MKSLEWMITSENERRERESAILKKDHKDGM